ncbi:hypothetical protein Pcinc_008271 [Petrolisthes cinctipes]|uniref:Uncharacterized protein n=1 Tax=Petrolisthes cinctipes TaxID=88211 RepID=A0AAE1G7L0_PETCI|nr:hypothetical protein Pcinc_008271 [Petrolisthes cinctipes]
MHYVGGARQQLLTARDGGAHGSGASSEVTTILRAGRQTVDPTSPMGSHPPLALSLVRGHVSCSSCHPCGPPPSLSSQPVCFQDSCYCIAINWVTGTSGFRSTLTILVHGAPSESP